MGDNMITLRGPNGERQIAENTPYRRLPGEYVVHGGLRRTWRETELQKLAQDNKVGVGDFAEAIFTSTGFKKWYNEKHGGECKSCQRNRVVLNYIQSQVPGWLAKWVKDTIKK